jgi:DNA-binding transcriptional regulator LsrR (DeoR family)
MKEAKARRLEAVARLYYEQDMTQSAIAKQLGISRPLVSRFLAEARDAGIVEIRINSTIPAESLVMEQARGEFGLKGGTLIRPSDDDGATNAALADAALRLVEAVGGGRLGVGWGHVIGRMVADLERRPAVDSKVSDVVPLIGNRAVPIRHYQSSEIVRVLASQLKARAHFLQLPSLAETPQEFELLRQTRQYGLIRAEWERLDVALVNIGNHPSTPDFATMARFGTLLTERRAVGRLIAYFFTVAGQIVFSDTDYAIQVPLDIMSRCPNIIGICSANVSADAATGALRSGLLTHIVATRPLMEAVLR